MWASQLAGGLSRARQADAGRRCVVAPSHHCRAIDSAQGCLPCVGAELLLGRCETDRPTACLAPCLLLGNLALNRLTAHIPSGRGKIAACPEGWESQEMWEFLSKHTRGPTFDTPHNRMRCQRWWSGHKEVHMVWHDFQGQHRTVERCSGSSDQGIETSLNGIHQHLPPALGAEDQVVVAQGYGGCLVSIFLCHQHIT